MTISSINLSEPAKMGVMYSRQNKGGKREHEKVKKINLSPK